MKVVFVSNYFNHHQKPFCEEMYRKFGNDFKFISTSVMHEERIKLGYVHNEQPPYALNSYKCEKQYKIAISLINDADVVIAGAAPNEMLVERIRQKKVIFRYSERPFKKKISFIKRIYHAFCHYKRDLCKNNIYMLCASAYAAGDYATIGMYKNRTYKWGYFPCVKEYDIDLLLSKKKKNSILWCGRFIDWKHPDDAVRLAQKLKSYGYDFKLNFVGTGTMEAELHQLIESLELTDSVCFLGSMSPDRVRKYMEESGIFLFTSDQQEGWGAVLNESMNSGCAVVVSNEIGSVPFLIKHKENGLVYKSRNVDDLFYYVKFLLDNHSEQIRLGKAAYSTITETWNAEIAAERLMSLIEEIQNQGFCDLYENGPCSRAKIM